MVLIGAKTEQNIPVVDVSSQRFNGRDDGVDADVEFMAVDEQRLVDVLLHECTGRFQIQLGQRLDLDTPVIVALLHEQVVRMFLGLIVKS